VGRRAGAPGVDRLLRAAEEELARPDEAELRARRVVERLALALQASLVARHSPPSVASAFLASRLGGAGGRVYGTLPPGHDLAEIVERHRPQL
jgi:putative acyl-CoA dehydrogenase